MNDLITSKIWDSVSCEFDVINYVTFHWLACGFMLLAMLQIEIKLQKCIRMGKTIFKFFIWGGILSDIWSEIMLFGSTCRKTLNFQPYIQQYTSPNEKFEYS